MAEHFIEQMDRNARICNKLWDALDTEGVEPTPAILRRLLNVVVNEITLVTNVNEPIQL